MSQPATQKTRLHELEIVIEEGKQTFIDVGNALAEIKEQELYKLTHKTFESYCKERWGFARSYASRVMEAAKVAEMLPMGNKPESERQARELAKAPAEKRAEVMEAAKAKADSEQRPVTARDIAEVVKPAPVAPEPSFSKPATVAESGAASQASNGAEVKCSASGAGSPLAYPVGQCLSELQGTLEIVLADYTLEDLRKVDTQLVVMSKRIARRIMEIKTENLNA